MLSAGALAVRCTTGLLPAPAPWAAPPAEHVWDTITLIGRKQSFVGKAGTAIKRLQAVTDSRGLIRTDHLSANFTIIAALKIQATDYTKQLHIQMPAWRRAGLSHQHYPMARQLQISTYFTQKQYDMRIVHRPAKTYAEFG